MIKRYNITPCPSMGALKVGLVYMPSFCGLHKCLYPNKTCCHCEYSNNFCPTYKRVDIAVHGYMLLKYGF